MSAEAHFHSCSGGPIQMKKYKFAFASLMLLALTLSVSISPLTRIVTAHDGDIPKLTYPETKKVEVVDTYFGTTVADPYRWMEDDNSPEVAAWVAAENKVTFGYLDKISYRPQLKDRLTKLLNYPKYSAPARRGENFIFSKNDGLQNQFVYYIQKGLDGTPEQLLDPNKFSADGTSQLGGFSLSQTGKYVAYGISEGGSDWRDFYVLDVATKKALPEHLQWIKFSGASWQGDEGFYYNRYPAPENGKKMTTKNDFQKIYYHKVGTAQSDDKLIYEDNEHPQRRQGIGVTEDQRFETLSVSDSSAGKRGSSVFFREL